MNPPLSVAWWPHTRDAAIASFRLRCLRVMQGLSYAGVRCELWHEGASPDVLVLSKQYGDDARVKAQALRQARGTKIVVDLCDNHFYHAGSDPRWEARSHALGSTLSIADQIVTSTEALAQVVRSHVADCPPVAVVGDAVEAPRREAPGLPTARHLHRMLVARRLRKLSAAHGAKRIKLIWFGNHGSPNADGGLRDLLLIADELNALHAQHPSTLTVISNNRWKFATIAHRFQAPTSYFAWNEHTFSALLQAHDIALIPISLNPFTICKTNNRLATALVHGVAVAATSIPSYEPFREAAVLDDWREGLSAIAVDAGLRQEMVSRGMNLIETNWSWPSIVGQWHTVLARVAGQDRGEHHG